MDQYIYYVYSHVDPRTDEIIYVGHGCRGRAWIHGSRKTCLRSQEHLDHLEDMTGFGFVATDWVEVIEQGLDKKSAAELERKIIKDFEPTYNKNLGEQVLKVTPEMYKLFEELRSKGFSYKDIGEECGVSTMTVFRAINNQTKNVVRFKGVS